MDLDCMCILYQLVLSYFPDQTGENARKSEDLTWQLRDCECEQSILTIMYGI